jgi:hypothetical protein
MENLAEAKIAITEAWPKICTECLAVLGSELHYQAMIYHLLREQGKVPLNQIGMNVKMWIDNPKSELFRQLDKKKHHAYQGGFEPIPDVVIFKPSINGDWRRRNYEKTILNMLIAIEVKASERANSRLQPAEITLDIQKLAAHREEAVSIGAEMFPVMLIIDSAPNENERMTAYALDKSQDLASELEVGFLYASPTHNICRI